MGTLDWIVGVGFFVLGVVLIAYSRRLSDDARRSGRRGWYTSPRWFVALGGFWLLMAALTVLGS